MARKGHGKGNFRRYMKGRINVDLALSTLASKVVISSVTPGSVVDTTRVSSIKASYSLSGFTPGENKGPIVVGVAHPDYTSSEIEAWIENTGGWDIGNMVQREVAARRIRQIGTFAIPEDATKGVVLNDGKPIRTKLNWVISEGEGLRFWAWNAGTNDLTTTDPNFIVEGHANLWAQ